MWQSLATHFAKSDCGSGFLGFPKWYAYLNTHQVQGICTPEIVGINDIWLIVAAAIEIMLRVAALVAVVYVIYAGYEYQMSRGNPDKANKARQTLINAVVGLVIAILSASIINLIAGHVGGSK